MLVTKIILLRDTSLRETRKAFTTAVCEKSQMQLQGNDLGHGNNVNDDLISNTIYRRN